MSEQATLPFGGATYDAERDGKRLGAQFCAVRDYLTAHRGEWVTLTGLSHALGFPEASVSARLRDMRKAEFGGYDVERKYIRRGLHWYRLK